MDPRRWREIQTIFDELVELDGAGRATRLASLASTDAELRRDVESLLAADGEASARLVPVDAAFRSDQTTKIDPLGLTGRTVSHFAVHELIGAGGMGAVYRATDTRLGRAVALKFLLPAYALDSVARMRFFREAHSVAALDHPSLCAIHEVETTDCGWPFLAMPLYAGLTLKARLVHGPLSQRDALEITRKVAQGLQAAHAAGIVHRDLKPGNIMLSPDGAVRILDFGLAKAPGESLSETGGRLGTVSYMSPEQVRGDQVDARSDLWALGVVLYEMLTARKPFDGDRDLAIAHAIVAEHAQPPSARCSDLSVALEDVVLRLLQKDPVRRYPSATALLADLDRLGTAREVTHGSFRRGWRHIRRLAARRSPSIAVPVAIVVLSLGAYAATTRGPRAGAATPLRLAIAVLPFRNLHPDSAHGYFASGLREEILSQLYRVPGIKVVGRNSVTAVGGPDGPSLQQLVRELDVGSVVDAGVQVVGNRVRVNVQLLDAQTEAPLWVERYDRTLDDAFGLQRDIAQQIVATVGAALQGGTGSTLAPKAQAYLFYLKGRDYDRRPGLQRSNVDSAIVMYEQALALDPDFALAHAAASRDHGHMYWLRYDMTPARLARQRAAAKAALRLAPELPEAHASMAGVHNVGPETDVRQALEELETALRGAPNDGQLWGNLAATYRRLGWWDRYDVPFQMAVRLDPRDSRVLSDFGGFTHERIGRYADAVRWYDRALRVNPHGSLTSVEKAWVYVSWRGSLDTLRAVMAGATGEKLLRERRFWWHYRFLLFERQADSLLRLLKWAHAVAPASRVRQTALVYVPDALYAAWAHQLRRDTASARASFDSALVLLDSAIAELPDDWPLHHSRGMALAGLGRRDEALREAQWLRTSFIYRKDLFLRPYVEIGAAQILAHAHEPEAAINDLDRLLSDRFPAISAHTVRLDPIWDPIRQHPRFKALLSKHAR